MGMEGEMDQRGGEERKRGGQRAVRMATQHDSYACNGTQAFFFFQNHTSVTLASPLVC